MMASFDWALNSSLLLNHLVILVIVLLLSLRSALSDHFPHRVQSHDMVTSNQTQWTQSRGSKFWVSKRHRQRASLAQTREKSINEILRNQQPPFRSVNRPLRVRGSAERWKSDQFSIHNSQANLVAAPSSQSNQIDQLESGPYFNQSHTKSFSLHTRSSLNPRDSQNSYQSKKRHHHGSHHRGQHEVKKRPNIILLLTDDQDIELGSMNYMPKTVNVLSRGGVHIKNAYVTTPMCCPSRSSILTGLYVHNHNVYTNGENCSSPQWQQTHERHTFATYLHDSGYRTAFFGKYLNEYNGSYIPPGWSHWSALIRNSHYYNYTLNVNGDRVRKGANYQLDYYPDLILNDSLHFMRYSNRFFSSKPYLMVMSFPSPHGPEDAAPQFQNLFLNEKGHRTPSWNYAPNQDKQWILRHTPKMAPIQQEFTDFLNAKRLQTLQSVDEAVHQIYTELKSLGELENTYIIYTSDHGYHLGQFGLVKGKAMPFEFDIRVPFYIRGPSVPVGRTLQQIVLNIDIAPTLLDIAGVKVPASMDGMSFLPFIKLLNVTEQNSQRGRFERRSQRQNKLQDKTILPRDSFLIEKGKFKVPATIDRLLIPIIGKKQWLQLECQKSEYQSPCKMFQKFECFQDENGTYRIRKCHRGHRTKKHSQRGNCVCPNGTMSLRNYDDTDVSIKPTYELKNSSRRARKHGVKRWLARQDRRVRRNNDDILSSLFAMFHDEPMLADPNGFDVAGVYELKKLVDLARTPSTSNSNANRPIRGNFSNDLSNITTSQLVSILQQQKEHFSDLSNYTDYLNRTFCTVARANLSIECTEEIYQNQESWKEKKDYIDSAIRQLQRRLFELKGIRRFMNEKRPAKQHRSDGKRLEECQCAGTADFAEMARMQVHPRRHVERRFMKHLHRKKWSRRHEKKMRKKEKFENTACEMEANEQMNCFTHSNEHWKTPPFWTHGPFCFCQNSMNNSFWCMRTINETHNFLYCEFVTGFILYTDLYKDPFQLKNAIYELEFSTVEEMSRNLARLKGCSGSAQCSSVSLQTIARRSAFANNSSKPIKGTAERVLKTQALEFWPNHHSQLESRSTLLGIA